MSKVELKDHIVVTIGGDPKEIKMSFGLLNELVRVVGDIEAVGDISFDIDLREALLVQILSERDEKGRITDPVNIFTLDISADQVIDVMDWVGSHVTDFLLKQMTRAKQMMDARQPQMKALMPTSTGSPA